MSSAQASNVPTMADYEARMTELGQAVARGEDAAGLALVKITEAAHVGVIDLTKDKYGPSKDDPTRMAEVYVKGRNATAVFSAKADKYRKLRSNFAKAIKFGSCTKFGPGEPIGVLDRLLTVRRKLLTSNGNAKRMDDTANSILRFMTAQLKRDTIIGDSELSTFIYKNSSPDKRIEKALGELVKGMMKLSQGKYPRCPDPCDEMELQTAISNLNTIRNRLLTPTPAPASTTP